MITDDQLQFKSRNMKMYLDWVCEVQQKKLGEEHGISPSRVAQIVHKLERDFGLNWHKHICFWGQANDEEVINALSFWKKKQSRGDEQ